jgi:UDP-N-acetylmuramyl tripeptide synthase
MDMDMGMEMEKHSNTEAVMDTNVRSSTNRIIRTTIIKTATKAATMTETETETETKEFASR